MTSNLAKSALALFASTALAVGPAAVAAPSLRPSLAVDTDANARPQLILAATHHRRHHAATTAHHRKGHHHHAAAASDEAAAEQPTTYKVRKGDTLGSISKKLGVSVAELKSANHVRGTALKVGQVLKIPGAEPAKSSRRAAAAERAEPSSYKVRKGETLAKVARKLGVSIAALREENGFTAKHRVRAGEVLKVPGREAEPEEATTSRRGRRGARPEAEETEAFAPTRGTSAAIGQVVETEGPAHTYRVKRGDTLARVAEKLGVSVAALKKENHLRRSSVKRGMVLRGRHEMVKAYVVAPTDTIYSISRRFDVSVERLKAENGLGRRGTIHTGEKLRLPAGYHDRGPSAGTFQPAYPSQRPANPSSEEPLPTAPATPRGYTPQPPVRPSYAPPVTTTPGNGPAAGPTQTPTPSDAQISELGRGRFVWPIQGSIVSDFGPKPGSQANAGINIQANTGDPVHAAAAGTVVYAGDQVPGYGNLVLINHADGWVTAYAHLSKVEVKMQQKVTQGQEIGLAGSTGGVSTPQVHFEVRYHANPADRAQPIDPKLVLPR